MYGVKYQVIKVFMVLNHQFVLFEELICFVEIEKELEKTDTKKIPILQSSKKRSVTDGDPMADGGQMSAGTSCYLSKCIYLFF